MQNTFIDQSFKYAGKAYTFIAYIHLGLTENLTSGIVLNNEDIVSFQYVNEFNQLFLTGELIFIDKYSVLDQFSQQQNVYCTISNIEHEYASDGSFNIKKLSEVYKFQHTFIINSIQILDRSENALTYKLTLIGKNWFNCVSNLTYSTYNTKKTDIFKILQDLIVQSGQLCEKTTFDKIKANVEIDYITQQNDNLISCFKYLLNKLMYFKTYTDSLKFLLYNESTNLYQLFDITDQYNTNGVQTVIISLFKTTTELQFQEQRVNVASVNKSTFKDVFFNIRNHDIVDYNYNINNFNDSSISSNTIVNYMNSKSVSFDDYQTKFKNITSELPYKKYGSFWNNDINIYADTVKILNNGNSLVLTIDGNIIIKPGSYIFIDVDRNDVTFTKSDSIEDLEDTKSKYKNLEGFWIVSKVRSIISVSGSIFRQNVVLFKNFIAK